MISLAISLLFDIIVPYFENILSLKWIKRPDIFWDAKSYYIYYFIFKMKTFAFMFTGLEKTKSSELAFQLHAKQFKMHRNVPSCFLD